MTLTVSIAERIGAVPKRTLVIGGFSSFLEQTLRPKLAAWGLKVEWHWEMGRRPRDVLFPTGCEVVVYFQDMVDVPATWATILKRALAGRPEVKLIRTMRKAAVWATDLERAGLKFDANHPLKEPDMPPSHPSRPTVVAGPPAEPSSPPRPASAQAPRTARDIIEAVISLLGELDAVLVQEERAQKEAAERLATLDESMRQLADAQRRLQAFDALRQFLKE